ncbi:DUF2977 domain-containing protein (plasmid) [Staphylococcus xylosus]|uniref:DUF2977 domain-containing protein n=1 Tax=Staphylococcus xylosus TaxID=1288 RepID=UPI003CF4BAFB
MQILVDNNNIITAFATVGGFDGGIDIDESTIPDTFIPEFKNGKFKYEDGSVIYNREYTEPVKEVEPPTNNEAMQQEVDSLRKQVEDLSALIQQLLNKE